MRDLEIQQEEIQQTLKDLNKVRDSWTAIGVINESDIPMDYRQEFSDLIIDFLDSKISIEEDLESDITSSIAFYSY